MSRQTARADWCVCTIPLSVLGQIPMKVGAPMAKAIAAVPYASAVKVGLQFKRRFWEEDEQIYGGITYTDLPISNIGYPSTGYFSDGKGVLLGAYIWGLDATEFTAMTPEERVAKAVEYGSQIHPQYPKEFDNGVAVAWHRSPFTMGCFGMWTEEARAPHYDALCAIDGRIVLAGEHASYIPAWQEGALMSALDAIGRLHRRARDGRDRMGHEQIARSRSRLEPPRAAVALATRRRSAGRRAEEGVGMFSVRQAQDHLGRGGLRANLPGLPHAGRQGRGGRRHNTPRSRAIAALASKNSWR